MSRAAFVQLQARRQRGGEARPSGPGHEGAPKPEPQGNSRPKEIGWGISVVLAGIYSRRVFPLMGHFSEVPPCPQFGHYRGKRTCRGKPISVAFDPARSAPGSWQRIGGESPPRGRSSQPPRPRVMHEVLLARAAVKRSQGRPRAKY
jgi:hypothetical protein